MKPWVPIKGLVRLVENAPNAQDAPNAKGDGTDKRYSDDQPRDDHGRWEGGGDSSDDSSGGGGGSSGGGGGSASAGYQPITADEARGNSRAVSAAEFQQLAQEGESRLEEMAANGAPTTGLDQNWNSIKDDAFQAAQQSWGGVTIDAHTGLPATTGYALTVKPPGIGSISIPENASQDVFNTAMDTARAEFADQLAQEGGHLGVFHDDELGRIDMDPVVVLNNLHDVETIGAATHAIGGAYNFADGNGYWPPHVAAPAMAGARYVLPAHRYSDDQPRDDHGRWTGGGSDDSSSGGGISPEVHPDGQIAPPTQAAMDRTMASNQGNPDAVAEVPDSQVAGKYHDSWYDYKTGTWRQGPDTAEHRGPPRIPPNYRPMDTTPKGAKVLPKGSHCGGCEMDNQGLCWGYGNVRIEGDHVCDSFAPEPATTGDATMDSELRYWETPEYRAKYTDDDRKTMAKDGQAMPDGSYPIKDKDDLDNAIHAVGRGGADHDAIRKHIIARAHALNAADAIPDNWNADGSLKGDDSRSEGFPPVTSESFPPGGKRNPALTGAAERRRKERHRAIPLGREVRFFAPTQVEVRHDDGNPNIVIEGAAIVYGAAYRVVDFFGEFRETIHAGSVSDLVSRVDCRLLFNHDGMPMARTVSRTMALVDTPAELRFRANLDARQQVANDFAIAIDRGDLSQMSVGMVVNRDVWGSDGGMETRDIFGMSDLPDISGVTYPCSPTTHIEVAKRMAFAMPLESRARLRQMEVELRAGKVLSADSQSKLVTALASLHDLAAAGGVDPASFAPDTDGESGNLTDGSEGNGSETDNGLTYSDGSGSRSAPETEAERRELSMSYGDRQTAVYEALLRAHPQPDTGMCDLWVCDMADDWVVYQSYGEPRGLFRCAYAMDDDGDVALQGEPQAVQSRTTYVPVQRSEDPLADLADDGCPHHDDEEPEEGTSPEETSTETPEGDGDPEAESRMKASTLRLLVEAGRKPSA